MEDEKQPEVVAQWTNYQPVLAPDIPKQRSFGVLGESACPYCRASRDQMIRDGAILVLLAVAYEIVQWMRRK
jgi:hypothetical protein